MGGSPQQAGLNEVQLDPLPPETPEILGVKEKPISGSMAETGNHSAVKMVTSRDVK